jgi:hypothetical protein
MIVNRVTSRNAPVARLAYAGFLACAVLRTAAADVIDTNRPGFSFTPTVVGKQTWQIETALTYLRSDGGFRQLSLPNAELRYGIGNDVEVFVSGINWNDAEFGSADASGLGDISFGTKIGLDISGEKLESAVLFLVSAPVGDDEFTSDRWDPSLGFVWTYSGRIPLAGTARITDRDDGLGFDNGLKLPVQIDERQTVFVEWEANFPARGSNSHWLNSGYQRLLSDDIQIDVAIDFSLSEFGDDYRFGVGFSTRF